MWKNDKMIEFAWVSIYYFNVIFEVVFFYVFLFSRVFYNAY